MGFLDFAKSAGGGSLLGGALGAVGSLINGSRSSDIAQAQMQMQREFAQNGIRWKVADAKAAGIHPLAALGAQTFSYNPVMVGDDGLGSALQQMGQGVSRAVEAKQLQEERDAAQARQEMADVFNMARSQKELEHMDLQNEFLRTQIDGARNAVTQTALPPPMPKVNDSGSDVFSVRHIRDNLYDINFNTEYQGELGDELGQAFNLLRKASRENRSIWTNPKTGEAYVFDRNAGYWHRLSALSVEEAERLLGKPFTYSTGGNPSPSSHFVRNRHRYRY